MLYNYARAPGASNRGERSELIWDKRPVHEIALDLKVKRNHKLQENKEELDELKALMKSFHMVDDVFY